MPFLGLMGKRHGEVEAVKAEGVFAIDSPGMSKSCMEHSEDFEENIERAMIDPNSLNDAKLQNLIKTLMDWINDELHTDRIIVQNIVEDLFDGQILQKLIEKLSGRKLNAPELAQSEDGQLYKLRIILGNINEILDLNPSMARWTVESIHSKNMLPILRLLVALARHYRAPIRLPENVVVDVIHVSKRDGALDHKVTLEVLTSVYDDLGIQCERDAFDTLFEHAPEKLELVKRSLITFVNKNLNTISLEVTDLETQFSDGVYLCLLVGLLEGFFIPLCDYFLTPKVFDEKVHNVRLAFQLMQDEGLAHPKARPADIVNQDIKSTLRVLYNLFAKYKHH